MKREIIRVELPSTYLENWQAPTSAVTRCDDMIYVSGFPPFDPATGTVIEAPIERQTGSAAVQARTRHKGGGR
jgi:2-iminobutanoate/2-iminopropanoate deaminase